MDKEQALSGATPRGMALTRCRVESLLRTPGPLSISGEWEHFPPRRLVSYLLSFLFHRESWVKWRAVTALGQVVNRMAQEDLESARNFMRQLMWSLNDESGGIGWGSAETMGEVMAVNETLAREYHRILLSYVQENGNPLENALLERGVLWGIGRLAQARPELVEGCGGRLMAFLSSDDPILRGHALWALSFIDAPLPKRLFDTLVTDTNEMELYEGGELRRVQIRELAGRCLAEGDGNGRATADGDSTERRNT